MPNSNFDELKIKNFLKKYSYQIIGFIYFFIVVLIFIFSVNFLSKKINGAISPVEENFGQADNQLSIDDVNLVMKRLKIKPVEKPVNEIENNQTQDSLTPALEIATTTINQENITPKTETETTTTE